MDKISYKQCGFVVQRLAQNVKHFYLFGKFETTLFLSLWWNYLWVDQTFHRMRCAVCAGVCAYRVPVECPVLGVCVCVCVGDLVYQNINFFVKALWKGKVLFSTVLPLGANFFTGCVIYILKGVWKIKIFKCSGNMSNLFLKECDKKEWKFITVWSAISDRMLEVVI